MLKMIKLECTYSHENEVDELYFGLESMHCIEIVKKKICPHINIGYYY